MYRRNVDPFTPRQWDNVSLDWKPAGRLVAARVTNFRLYTFAYVAKHLADPDVNGLLDMARVSVQTGVSQGRPRSARCPLRAASKGIGTVDPWQRTVIINYAKHQDKLMPCPFQQQNINF